MKNEFIEIPQLYLGYSPAAGVPRKFYASVVTMTLALRDMSIWDTLTQKFVKPCGTFTAYAMFVSVIKDTFGLQTMKYIQYPSISRLPRRIYNFARTLLTSANDQSRNIKRAMKTVQEVLTIGCADPGQGVSRHQNEGCKKLEFFGRYCRELNCGQSWMLQYSANLPKAVTGIKMRSCWTCRHTVRPIFVGDGVGADLHPGKKSAIIAIKIGEKFRDLSQTQEAYFSSVQSPLEC
ncbi:hypothetical protein C8J56DRAFT_882947 [Mycena floridula]|nr:hypothetical protein C8J56DRAFT_882947 [Mycena floridula]